MKHTNLYRILVAFVFFRASPLWAQALKLLPKKSGDIPLIVFFTNKDLSPKKISLKATSTKAFQDVPLLKIVPNLANSSNKKRQGKEIKLIERQATIDYVPWEKNGPKASEIFNPLDQLIKK
jgi:hypothetical protein